MAQYLGRIFVCVSVGVCRCVGILVTVCPSCDQRSTLGVLLYCFLLYILSGSSNGKPLNYSVPSVRISLALEL